MRLLNNRSPHYLVASYKKELKALPSVNPGYAFGLRKFPSFLLKYKTFSKSTTWNPLETPETLWILVWKLPGSLRDRWNKDVQMVRINFGREPCWSDFASFAHEEITLVYDRIFLRDPILEYVQIPEKKRKIKKKKGSFSAKGGEVVKCSLCEGYDDLDDCNSFLVWFTWKEEAVVS